MAAVNYKYARDKCWQAKSQWKYHHARAHPTLQTAAGRTSHRSATRGRAWRFLHPGGRPDCAHNPPSRPAPTQKHIFDTCSYTCKYTVSNHKQQGGDILDQLAVCCHNCQVTSSI